MKRYPKAVDEAIWALMVDGLPAGTILERVHQGTAAPGLDPCPMPRRTFFDHVRKLKAERGEPVPELPRDVGEGELAEGISRRLLELAHRQTSRLERADRKGLLSAKEVSALARLVREVEDVRRRLERRTAAAESPNQPTRAHAASPGGSVRDILARLTSETGAD